MGGSFQAPPNSAITINGQLAITTPGGQFFINHVPLQLGINTITVIVTAPDGQTATQTISITRNAPATPPPNTPIPPIFAVSVGQGGTIAPNATLSVPVSIAVVNNVLLPVGSTISLACLVPAPGVTITDLANGGYQCTYTSAGLFNVNITIKNAANTILYTTTRQVKVDEPVQKFRGVIGIYNDVLDRLKVNNIDGAVAQFTSTIREQYRTAFTQAGVGLNPMVNGFGSIKNVRVTGDFAEIIIAKPDSQGDIAFSVFMIQDGDGIWRIDSF